MVLWNLLIGSLTNFKLQNNMKTVELTKEQCDITVTALSYYHDLIFMGDVNGTVNDLVTIQHIIGKL